MLKMLQDVLTQMPRWDKQGDEFAIVVHFNDDEEARFHVEDFKVNRKNTPEIECWEDTAHESVGNISMQERFPRFFEKMDQMEEKLEEKDKKIKELEEKLEKYK